MQTSTLPGSALGSITAAPAVAAPVPARDTRTYTPKHRADKILQSRSALEGERKQVTVLFAGVRGSMELAEQLGPEERHSILERFFAILTEVVNRFEGTVNQCTGDGVMSRFGAPIAHEDHAHERMPIKDSLIAGQRSPTISLLSLETSATSTKPARGSSTLSPEVAL